MTHNHEPTAEELNLQLYEKLEAEFAAYRAELINLPADEILEQAAGYVTREDILLSLEYTDLNRQQAAILLKSEHPLFDIYLKWNSAEHSYMNDLWDSIEASANEKLRAEFISAAKKRDKAR